MKEIKGFEGLYSIDEKANVLSVKSGKHIKPYLCYGKTSGLKYLQVYLSNGSKSKKYKLHRLVAETFLPNPTNLPYVDHINRDPSNNSIENLRWCTRSQNQQNKGVKSNSKTSKYKGVSWSKLFKRWMVYVNIETGKTKNFGSFKD